MMRKLTLIAVFLLAACGKNPAEQLREDDQAVAAVNAAQNRLPPVQPFVPEFLSSEDMARMDGAGGRCSYHFPGPHGRSNFVLVTMGSFGWIKNDSELIKLAADTGSAGAPARTWTHYTGRNLTLRIDNPRPSMHAPPNSHALVEDLVTLTVRDQYDRAIFREELAQDCTG